MYSKFLSNFKEQIIKDTVLLRTKPKQLDIEFLGIFPHCARSPYRNQIICSPYIHLQLASGDSGICFIYKDFDISPSFEFVGHNAISVLENEKPEFEIEIVIVDALFGLLNRDLHLQKTINLRGRPSSKALRRGNLIASQVNAKPGDKVGLIGCVEAIVRALIKTGCELRIADMHSRYDEMGGVQIERDAMAAAIWADKLIISGSALWTNTMGEILNLRKERDCLTVVYAMTGHNIAPFYLDYGADVVVAESFPYYWFANSTSNIKIFKKETT